MSLFLFDQATIYFDVIPCPDKFVYRPAGNWQHAAVVIVGAGEAR
jgi:hypothetical protein